MRDVEHKIDVRYERLFLAFDSMIGSVPHTVSVLTTVKASDINPKYSGKSASSPQELSKKKNVKKTAKKEKVKDEVNLRWSLRWTTTGADSWPWICVSHGRLT